MWVFGYGSLIWDHWETELGCLRRVHSELPGYVRSFNKASVKNWGTKTNRGPTLNLVPDIGRSCRGIAFEFPDSTRTDVLDYLAEREGKNFRLSEHRILLEGGGRTWAIVPIYFGKNLIAESSIEERARMVLAASGDNGACYDYVENIAEKLAELGIEDAAVTDLWHAVQSLKGTNS
jgi:cation transport protein ChaC